MAEPPDTLLAQIGVGLTTVLGWFWAMLNGNRKKIEELRDDLAEHEKRVLSDYPKRSEMHEALDKTVRPIHEKLDDTVTMLHDIKKTLDRDRDEELKELRKMAKDRREH